MYRQQHTCVAYYCASLSPLYSIIAPFHDKICVSDVNLLCDECLQVDSELVKNAANNLPRIADIAKSTLVHDIVEADADAEADSN